MRRLRHAILALTTAACGEGDGATGFGDLTGPAATTAPAGSTSSGSSSTSTGAPDSTSVAGSSTTSSGPGFDMPVPDLGDPPPVGCKGKIDFLFVISAAGTMQGSQAQLLESFPGFMAAIEEQVPDFDVHILVADPDSYWGSNDCSLCQADCDPQGTPPLCGAVLDACDTQIGAGMTFPAGKGATNRRCELAGGRRYITREEPDLLGAFSCVAQVGLWGGDTTSEAMVHALGPALNGTGGCNEGFLREDALLVVTIINDGYDQDSAGTVNSWIKALRAAKHEDDDAFALLVLTTDVDVGPWELCVPGEFSPNKNPLRQFVEGVEHGFIGSICEKSYTPFFAEAVDELVQLCEGFVLPQ